MNRRHLMYLDLEMLELGGSLVSRQPKVELPHIGELPRPLVSSVERLARLLERCHRADGAERRRLS